MVATLRQEQKFLSPQSIITPTNPVILVFPRTSDRYGFGADNIWQKYLRVNHWVYISVRYYISYIPLAGAQLTFR